MARLFRDLKVNESDGKVRLNLYNRDGSVALRDVSAEISSEIVQLGDRWSAAAANRLLKIDENGQPQVALTPKDIGAANEQDGVQLYDCKKTGTQHVLTGQGDNIRFTAAADFTAGDTFSVNGVACTAKTAAGDALWSGYFKSGAVVVCWRSGNNLTFNGGGLPAPQAAKLTPENIKTGVSVEVNGKTVTGTFTADANGISGAMQKGYSGYVKGRKVEGNLEYLGNQPKANRCGLYDNHLYFYFGDEASRYILERGIKFPQKDVANKIGLTPGKIMQGNTILGVQGTVHGGQGAGAITWGAVLALRVGEQDVYANVRTANGWANPNLGSISNIGVKVDEPLRPTWICKKAGQYGIIVIGSAKANVSGVVNLRVGDQVYVDVPGVGDIYFRDAASGGVAITYLMQS